MIIDKKEQQRFLLGLFSHATFADNLLELAYETKQAIKNATITDDTPTDEVPSNLPGLEG